MTRESEWIKHYRPEPHPHEAVESMRWSPLKRGVWITMLGLILFMAGMTAIHLGWAFGIEVTEGKAIESYPRLVILGLIGHGLGIAVILIGAAYCFFGPRQPGELAPAAFAVLFALMAVAVIGYGLVVFTAMLGETGPGDAIYALAALLVGEGLIWLALAAQLVLMSNVAAGLHRTKLAMSARTFMFFWLLSPLLAYVWVRLAWHHLVVGDPVPGSGHRIIAWGIGLLVLVNVIWFVCIGIETLRAIPKPTREVHREHAA